MGVFELISNRRIKVVLALLLLGIVIGFSLFFLHQSSLPVTRVVLRVESLTNDSFLSSLKPTLMRVKGVQSVLPDFSSQIVEITFRPDLTSRYALADVIDKAGHQTILPKAKGSSGVQYQMYLK